MSNLRDMVRMKSAEASQDRADAIALRQRRKVAANPEFSQYDQATGLYIALAPDGSKTYGKLITTGSLEDSATVRSVQAKGSQYATFDTQPR